MTATLASRVRSSLLCIDGVVESPGIFYEGDAFWVNGKQIGEFDGDNVIGLRLSRPMIIQHRARLKTDPRIDLRRPGSDWILVRFSRRADVALVCELAELTASVYRAPPGTTPKPPPTGAVLERMRRFH